MPARCPQHLRLTQNGLLKGTITYGEYLGREIIYRLLHGKGIHCVRLPPSRDFLLMTPAFAVGALLDTRRSHLNC
jgi:hypothetical protein